jgi:hypothetical protein
MNALRPPVVDAADRPQVGYLNGEERIGKPFEFET